MKIQADLPVVPSELAQAVPTPSVSFEESLGLAATLRVRRSGLRAFAFSERGVLSPSDRAGSVASTDLPVPTAVSQALTPAASPVFPPAEPGQQPVLTAGHIATGGADPVAAGQSAALGRSVGEAAVPVKDRPTPPALTRSSVPPTPEPAPRGRLVKPLPATRTGGEATPGADMLSLVTHFTADGVVVVAAASEFSPMALAQLRARAEAIARDHGQRLVELRLNGALVAPQSLSGRA